MRTLARSLLLILCSWLLLGPQFFLQIGAWGWMVATYSQEASFETAVKDTFSGERPCDLCKIIEATEAETDGNRLPRLSESHRDLHLVLLSDTARPAVPEQSADSARPVDELGPPMFCGQVPVPPPRCV